MIMGDKMDYTVKFFYENPQRNFSKTFSSKQSAATFARVYLEVACKIYRGDDLIAAKKQTESRLTWM